MSRSQTLIAFITWFHECRISFSKEILKVPIWLFFKVEKILKVAWIRSHHLYLPWNFKLWEVCLRCKTVFNKLLKTESLLTVASNVLPLLPQVKFPAHNLNFHWRWRWWDQIQAIFLNFFYVNKQKKITICSFKIFQNRRWACY